jgi:diguanylate cyclase (GGDEF)-like protein
VTVLTVEEVPMASACRSLARWAVSLRAWPIWELPSWLVAVIVLVVAAHAAAIGFAVSSLTIRPHDLVVFGTLLACAAATVELRRKKGADSAGVNTDVYGVWELAIAILLPPAYALIAPIVTVTLIQLRVRRTLAYRRVYSASSFGLSFGAASVTFHLLAPQVDKVAAGTALHGLAWLAAVFASGLVKTTLNKVLIMTAIKGSDPSAPVIKDIFGREPLYNELAELCIGALLTFGIAAGNLFLAPVALPVLVLLQRSLSHAQLLNDSRTDAKTGLLNARTWEREATAEVARAVRARTALAVAVLDIDWFKLVNDTYGHLFGDEVLKEIARCLPGVLREYDSAGRFGGEEFVLLLPHTRAVDAFRIADRVRDHISGLSLHTPDGQAVRVTVSVGVAALDAGSRRELSDLLAAADAALYRAKRDGRDQVQMISTSRGLSAVGARTASGVDVFSEAPAKPSAWDVLPGDRSRTAGDTDEVAARV